MSLWLVLQSLRLLVNYHWRVGRNRWQQTGLFKRLMVSLAYQPRFSKGCHGDKDADVAAGPEIAVRVFKAAADAREISKTRQCSLGMRQQIWSLPTRLVVRLWVIGLKVNSVLLQQTAGNEYSVFQDLVWSPKC